MSERTLQQQEPAGDERPEAAAATALIVLLVLVPAAFVAGWNARRRLHRMLGYA